MQKKQIPIILLIVTAVLFVAGLGVLAYSLLNPPAPDLILGQMQIVLPAEATTLEKTAAEELQTYVQKMTGEELEIVTEGNETAAGIYIGATEYASAKRVKYEDNKLGEGWAIKAVDGNLVLCGGAQRGVLYAVYHLLEDGFGVHWWTYWDEYVPTLTEARLSGKYNDSGVPAFIYREIWGGGAAVTNQNLFSVRNRVNGETSNAPTAYGGEEYAGTPAPHHTMDRYITKDYFNQHPEWFAFVGGGRVPDGQLCMTNEELVEVLTEMVLENIASDYKKAEINGTNKPHFYDISPGDNTKFCTCDACSTVTMKSGESGLLLQFVNKIAAAVEQEYPEVLIRTQAYSVYMDPPKDDTKPADNVLLYLADSDMDVLHAYSDVNNESFLERVKEWEALTADGQFYVWNYMVFYGTTGVAPTVMNYAENLRTLKDYGVDGYFGEMEYCIATDFWDMKYWVCAKLLEDPYQDEDALIDTFLNGYYGEAAPYVRQYLELMNQCASEYTGYWTFAAGTLNPRWIKVDDAIAANELFEQAFAAVGDDETLLIRLRMARNCLDRVIVENYDTYVEQAEEQGVSFDISEGRTCQRIITCLTEQIALRGEYDVEAESILNRYVKKFDSMD